MNYLRLYLLIIFLSWPALCTPTLTVVTELSPPNQTLINNQVTGESTELVKAIFAKANLNAKNIFIGLVKWQPTKWALLS